MVLKIQCVLNRFLLFRPHLDLYQSFYALNFEKVGSILLSACACVRPFKKKSS